MESHELFASCLAVWSEQVQGISADDWGNPTPCTEWDVRALVNHLVGEELWLRPLLEGRTIAEVGDRFDGDLLGADPLQIAKEAEADSADAVSTLHAAAQVVHLSYGDESTENCIRQMSADHLIHAWDLASGLGRRLELPAALVSEVAAWFADWEPLYRQAGIVAERPASDGSAQGELLAAFGRSLSWATG